MNNKKHSNKLKIKINFEGFKLEVSSDDPNKTLSELNRLFLSKKKLFDSINNFEGFDVEEIIDDHDITFNFQSRMITKELRSKKDSMEKIRNLVLKHGDFIYKKETIEIKKEIDLDNKSLRTVIEKKDVSKIIKKILFDIDVNKIKHIYVHVIGDNIKEHKYLILDHLKKNTGFAESSFVETKKKINDAIVTEVLLFGDFPEVVPEDY